MGEVSSFTSEQKFYFEVEIYRLSTPYPKCLGLAVFQILGILELQLGPRSQHKIPFCLIVILSK